VLSPSVRVIGWDAAVDPRNNALARLTVSTDATGEPGTAGGRWTIRVDRIRDPRTSRHLVETVAEWCTTDAMPVMLCVDAPIGWPEAMGTALVTHRAGEPIEASADALFRRHTDHDIRRRLGKTPLDIGADRIARAALATLRALDDIRTYLRVRGGSRVLQVATTTAECLPRDGIVPVLESYPAGWFASEGIPTRGYRPPAAEDRRSELWAAAVAAQERGGRRLALDVPETAITARADDLDAVVAAFNGIDALTGRCPGPHEGLRTAVEREGWIWCKDRMPA